MKRQEIKIGNTSGTVAEESTVHIVGQISQKDMDDGTVIIFRIDNDKYPAHVIKQIGESIKQAVTDNFNGQIKAMIVSSGVEVQVLRDILQDTVSKGEDI